MKVGQVAKVGQFVQQAMQALQLLDQRIKESPQGKDAFAAAQIEKQAALAPLPPVVDPAPPGLPAPAGLPASALLAVPHLRTAADLRGLPMPADQLHNQISRQLRDMQVAEQGVTLGKAVTSVQAASLAQGTMRAHLTSLQKEDPECIFVARRINKLGFRSREILQRHYENLVKSWNLPRRQVEACRVLVAHSKVKPFQDKEGWIRTRPGGLGLIVMGSAEGVRRILALGQKQVVAGHEIRVQPFNNPNLDDVNDTSGGIWTRSTTAQSGVDGDVAEKSESSQEGQQLES
jgi:hypothetical protein